MDHSVQMARAVSHLQRCSLYSKKSHLPRIHSLGKSRYSLNSQYRYVQQSSIMSALQVQKISIKNWVTMKSMLQALFGTRNFR